MAKATASIPSPTATIAGLFDTVSALKQSADSGTVTPQASAPTAVATKIGAAISAVTRLNP